MIDRTPDQLLSMVKYVMEITIDAAERVLERIESAGVTDRDRKDVETLRRGLEYADDQMEAARHTAAIRADAELERLATRLRERIALIDGKVAAAKPN
jgi:hypothetical protein